MLPAASPSGILSPNPVSALRHPDLVSHHLIYAWPSSFASTFSFCPALVRICMSLSDFAPWSRRYILSTVSAPEGWNQDLRPDP